MPIVKKVVDKLVCPENNDCKSDMTDENMAEMDENACVYTCDDKDKFLFVCITGVNPLSNWQILSKD